MGTLKLLPCPFCGNKNPAQRGIAPFHYVACVLCLAEGPHATTVAKAVNAWNRRSDRAGLIAGLREAAGLARTHAAGCDDSGGRVVCKLIEHDIRARITALEEEK